MKKRIFCCIAVLAVAMIAAINVNLNSQKNDLTSVSLNNVEALSDVECKTSSNGRGGLLTVCTGKHSSKEKMKDKEYCTVTDGTCTFGSDGTGS